MRSTLKKILWLKKLVIVARAFSIKPGYLKRVQALGSFFKDLRKYEKTENNPDFALNQADLFPRIYDKTVAHGTDPVYFYQGSWCAGKVFKEKPSRHYDIGSQAIMVGIISQFTPTTMIDIRPIKLDMPGLSFIEGDITHLPMRDGEVESLSSICVIEHIGLGRYGDTLDQFGTEKAARELARVLKKSGSLYISVPVDSQSKIYFNAHRAFTREHVMKLFEGLTLVEEKYIYGRTFDAGPYSPEKGFGTGLYHFKKPTS